MAEQPMTGPEMVEAVREKFGLTIPVATELVAWFFDTIADQIVAGRSVVIKGFGGFHVRVVPPRKGNHPSTGVPFTSAGKTTLHFKPGRPVLDRLAARHTPSERST